MGEESIDILCEECKYCGNGCAEAYPLRYVDGCESYSPKNMGDKVNHPIHYTQGGIECIKAIEASMSPFGFQDYCKGNVLKYIWRWRDKDGVQDLEKAEVYLKWMIESAKKCAGGIEECL